MIRPTASVLVLLFGLLATAAGAADPADAAVEKDGARNLRGLVNKIVSPLKSYNPTRPGPDYNPTRPAPIDPKYNPTMPIIEDPKYNPTMPPMDDPNYKPGTSNLRGLIGDVTVRKKPGITYNPTRPRPSPDYQPTLPAPGIIDPLDDPIKYNPTRPRDHDKYNPTMPAPASF